MNKSTTSDEGPESEPGSDSSNGAIDQPKDPTEFEALGTVQVLAPGGIAHPGSKDFDGGHSAMSSVRPSNRSSAARGSARRSIFAQDELQMDPSFRSHGSATWNWRDCARTEIERGTQDIEMGVSYSWCVSLKVARLRLWLFLEEPFETWRASVLSTFAMAIITASIIRSVCSLAEHGGEGEASVQTSFGDLCIGVGFCCELAVRLWAFPARSHFLTDPKNAIDAVCIAPFIVNEVLFLHERVPGLGFLRWLSSYEAFLRLMKYARYFWGWQLLFRAVSDSAKALVIPGFFLVLILGLGSCALHMAETMELEAQQENGFAGDGLRKYELVELEIVNIRSLLDAIHFSSICVLSMSTGPFYGMQAVSRGGQVIVCALMVFGMLFMAMPIAIVGYCFSETWFNQDRILLLDKVRTRLQAMGYTHTDIHEVFHEVDADGTGELEFHEFKCMIKSFNLRSLNASKVRSLFELFDSDNDGLISFMDFAVTLYPDMPIDLDHVGESCDLDKSSESSTSSSDCSVHFSATRQRHNTNEVKSLSWACDLPADGNPPEMFANHLEREACSHTPDADAGAGANPTTAEGRTSAGLVSLSDGCGSREVNRKSDGQQSCREGKGNHFFKVWPPFNLHSFSAHSPQRRASFSARSSGGGRWSGARSSAARRHEAADGTMTTIHVPDGTGLEHVAHSSAQLDSPCPLERLEARIVHFEHRMEHRLGQLVRSTPQRGGAMLLPPWGQQRRLSTTSTHSTAPKPNSSRLPVPPPHLSDGTLSCPGSRRNSLRFMSAVPSDASGRGSGRGRRKMLRGTSHDALDPSSRPERLITRLMRGASNAGL